MICHCILSIYLFLRKSNCLNRQIKQFKHCASDAFTKPCEFTPQTAQLSRQAVQNWNLLRLLSLITGDKVKDTADVVWHLTLQLKDIVEVICAQQISVLGCIS